MERLTAYDADDYAYVKGGKVTNKKVAEAILRLAAYEDTGLTPEEIPRWIPVSERLPTADNADKYCAVLAVHKASTKQYWHWKSVADNPFDFTYWMTLPKPPKEEK